MKRKEELKWHWSKIIMVSFTNGVIMTFIVRSLRLQVLSFRALILSIPSLGSWKS